MAKQTQRKNGHGISRRWMIHTLLIIAVFLAAAIISVCFVIQYYKTEGTSSALQSRAEEVARIYQAENLEETSFAAYAGVVTQDQEEQITCRMISADGKTYGDSGNTELLQEQMAKAQESEDATSRWSGRLSDGSSVVAVTHLVSTDSGRVVGAVFYSGPASSIGITVLWVCLIMTGAAVLMYAAFCISTRRYLRELLRPIQKITITANKIAQGDFNIRLQKRRNDEIGELCDAINDMAVSLDTSEKMKNEFISSVSHELRTPLTAIKGWAETLQGGGLDQQMIDRGLQVIIRESERLSGIVEELLDFSRMQSGKMKTDMKKCSLLGELGEAVYMFSDRAKAEGKYLLYNEPKYLSPVYGDLNRLRQVFVNLLDNALKYTDTGGTINVSVREEAGLIYVKVADNGCGIPAVHLPNVRRKFYKANTTARGSGIGLALADEIMALHAGGMQIESKENLGTVVTVFLPTYDHYQRQISKINSQQDQQDQLN